MQLNNKRPKCPVKKTSDVAHLEKKLAKLAVKAPAAGLIAAITALEKSMEEEAFLSAVRKSLRNLRKQVKGSVQGCRPCCR